MSYNVNMHLVLGPAMVGKTLKMQGVDSAGADVGAAVTTGFVEAGGGNYYWNHDFADGSLVRGLEFRDNGTDALYTFAAADPPNSWPIATLAISLGGGQTGLTLQAVIQDESGTPVGAPILTGFVEIGSGFYMWTHEFDNEEFEGFVVIQNSADDSFLTSVPVAPPAEGGVAPGTPTSKYTTYERFLRRWGTKNVTEASEKDNTAQTPNLAAVQDAFDFADGEIDDGQRGGVLKSPLDFSPWNDVVPQRVVDWANVLAFSYLYESRGWQEKTAKKNKVKLQTETCYQDMQQVRNGYVQINAATNVDSNGVSATQAGEASPAIAGAAYRLPDGSTFWAV